MLLDERNRRIKFVVDSMEQWDGDALLQWAQACMTEQLSEGSLEDLDAAYETATAEVGGG